MRNLFDRGSSPLFPALAPLTPQTDAGPVAMVRLVAHASSTVGVLLARGTSVLPDSSPPSVWLWLRGYGYVCAQLCAHAYRRTKAFPSTVRVCSAAPEIGRFAHQLRKPGFMDPVFFWSVGISFA
jgi:hypothetical protein